MAPTFKSKFVHSSDGTRIYADAVGEPTKPCIVFIHGLSLSAAVFDDIFNDQTYTNEFYLVYPQTDSFKFTSSLSRSAMICVDTAGVKNQTKLPDTSLTCMPKISLRWSKNSTFGAL